MNSEPPTSAPAPSRRAIPRPAFARWIWERGYTLKEIGDAIECSYEHVRLICLPFVDAKRRVPEQELMRRIHAFTEGEIGFESWYPADLQSALIGAGVRGGDPDVLKRARAS